MTKPVAIVCDIDSTLADNSHRIKLIKDPSGQIKKDWQTYRHLAPNDPPFRWCVELLRGMQLSGHKILFLTGRNESERDVTTEWLMRHVGFLFDADGAPNLYMRDDGDYTQDYTMKRKVMEKEILPKYDVLMCVDDRKQCVEAYRSMGLVCLACADND